LQLLAVGPTIPKTQPERQTSNVVGINKRRTDTGGSMDVQQGFHQTPTQNNLAGATPEPEPDETGADNSLEDAARDERDYARTRLSEQLSREPTEDEINEWLRQQTEGY
jgi:hypothetical protein